MSQAPSSESMDLQPDGPRVSRLVALVCHPAFIGLLLAAVTLAVFWQVRGFQFINYDDPDYFSANAHVRQGLTRDGLAWAFTTTHAGNWHPLTWLSLMLDAQLFGAHPAGPHLVNVLFHAANTILLFAFLALSTGARWRSALVAALFALHPLHVESVAWVAERKDLLCTFFGLLALIAYSRYAENRAIVARAEMSGESGTHRVVWKAVLNYFLVLLCFGLGLMSKPMLVTLPCLFLLLDFWPLRGFESGPAQADPGGLPADAMKPGGGRGRVWSLVIEKMPFFLLSAVSCVVTYIAQNAGGAVYSLERLPMIGRMENALVSYARYLARILWPLHLAVPYPHPGQWSWMWVVGSAVLVVAMSVAAWRFRRSLPFVFSGWFWFLGLLVPVIGLVQVGNQAMADRYTYLPAVGIFITIAWGAGAVVAHWRLPGWTAAIAGVIVVSICGALTAKQAGYWRDSETLFSHTLELLPDSNLAHDNLASALFDRGNVREAALHYQRSLGIRADDPVALDGLGCCYFSLGHAAEAIELYRRALEINPRQPVTLFNLASVYASRGDYPQAIEFFQASLKVQPDSPDAWGSLGRVFLLQGRYGEAARCYEAVLRLRPDDVEATRQLGALRNPAATPGNR